MPAIRASETRSTIGASSACGTTRTAASTISSSAGAVTVTGGRSGASSIVSSPSSWPCSPRRPRTTRPVAPPCSPSRRESWTTGGESVFAPDGRWHDLLRQLHRVAIHRGCGAEHHGGLERVLIVAEEQMEVALAFLGPVHREGQRDDVVVVPAHLVIDSVAAARGGLHLEAQQLPAQLLVRGALQAPFSDGGEEAGE